MSQHLGHLKNSNMLRKYLKENGKTPEQCEFRLVALGPLEEESTSSDRAEHDSRRDLVAGMEKALADTMRLSGYIVMNDVNSRKPLDSERFAKVQAAFAKAFPNLK